jgi:hypothetical protein
MNGLIGGIGKGVMIVCTTIEIKFFYFKFIHESSMWMIKHLGGLINIIPMILFLSPLLLGLLVLHFSIV